MTTGKLDRRTAMMLVGGVAAVLLLKFTVFGERQTEVVAAGESVPQAEARLARLRQIVATVPGKQELLEQAAGELAVREKGLIQADTAPQAQAQLLELIRKLAQAEGIAVRGAEEMRIQPLGDYGEVMVTVAFGCRIEQLVNLMAALTNEPQLLATNELQVSTGNQKDKTLQVRLRVSGMAPRKLVPEKKGGTTF